MKLEVITTMRVLFFQDCLGLEASSELAEENFSVLRRACHSIQIPDACIVTVKNFENGDVAAGGRVNQ